MLTRKRKSHPKMDTSNGKKKRKTQPQIILEETPKVENIRDLIKLSNSLKFYKNIDIVMLWRITPYLQQLDDMIGMDKLKETLFYQVIYYLQGMHLKNENGEYLHTVIYGAPGSGKTTVAKIIGKIYQSLNILSPEGQFRIAYRDDFVAGYLGQTATKTKKLLNSCIGGVLFIDEVYSLAPKDTDRDSFSKEAIDTITGFLSEHRNDFCCIIAGYENEINNCFFAMNEGLQRRFPWTHRIDEYNSSQLYQIFLKMVRETNWDISSTGSFMISIFDNYKHHFEYSGGAIETFLSKCKMTHAKRVFCLDKTSKFIITDEDVKEAIKFMEKNNNLKPENKPPEHMYI